MTHTLWKKNTVKHWLTVVKLVKIAKIYTEQLNQTTIYVMVCL